MKRYLLYCALGAVIVLMSCTNKSDKQNPLLGSWAIDEVHWISEDTALTRIPVQKGILLVTPTSYSICWTPNTDRRTPFRNLSAPSEEEILAGFNSIVFNTGSYTYSETSFNTEAHMAKVPGFEGGLQYYDYKIIGDQMTLTLFDETYPNGEKPNWYGTWRTRFNLTRLPINNTE